MRLLIVEDTESTAEGSANLFRQDGYEVKYCGNYAAAIALYHDFQPNVVIIDAMIPAVEGIEAKHNSPDTERGFILADALKSIRPKLSVIMTSAHDELERPYLALVEKWKTGIGFVNKGSHQQYQNAVREILAGGQPLYGLLRPRLTPEEIFLGKLRPESQQVVLNAYARLEAPRDGLTPEEWKVAQIITLGLTAAGIAENIEKKPSNIRKHLQNIYEKLGITRVKLRPIHLEPSKVLDWVMTLHDIRTKDR